MRKPFPGHELRSTRAPIDPAAPLPDLSIGRETRQLQLNPRSAIPSSPRARGLRGGSPLPPGSPLRTRTTRRLRHSISGRTPTRPPHAGRPGHRWGLHPIADTPIPHRAHPWSAQALYSPHFMDFMAAIRRPGWAHSPFSAQLGGMNPSGAMFHVEQRSAAARGPGIVPRGTSPPRRCAPRGLVAAIGKG